MEIFACPKCGSRNIHIGTIRDGVLDGYTSRYVCRDCDYQGMPIVFDSEEEYISFLQELKEGKKGGSKKGKIRLTEEDKRIVQTLKEDLKGEEKRKKQVEKTGRPIGIVFLSTAMILQGLLGVYLLYRLNIYNNVNSFVDIYYSTLFILSALILPYGFLKGKKWAWTLGGTLFVLSLPVGLPFLYYLTRPHVKTYFGK